MKIYKSYIWWEPTRRYMGRMRAPLLAGLFALAACSTLPSERAAAPELPQSWANAPAEAAVPLEDWWRRFDDPALDSLIQQALTEGPSAQLAALRVREARALSYTTVTQYLPELTATGRGQFTRAMRSRDALDTASGGSEREQMIGTYGAEASWEIPLFAQIQTAAVGARANTQSAIADLRGARVALVADVAQAYVDLRAANASRIALQRSVDNADQLARILETSAAAGFISTADAADARRLAESARARLPSLAIEARRAENVLSVLRGRAPGTETPEIQAVFAATGAPAPHLELTSAPAAPADLLRLRPDIARAEAQTLLAAASLADARAQLLPQINLTGSITTSDTLIGDPINVGATLGRAAPVISIPLFDWGSRFAHINQRDAQFEQSLVQYRQTVTQAVAEASNALEALEQGRLRLQAARAAETAAEATARGSRAAFGAGIQSLADRLRSEQQLIDANLTRIEAEAQLARAAIATYRAFGGGPSF